MIEKIGNYRIIDKIGSGAMGLVYKGFDTKMGRYVAIKVMYPQFVNNAESRSRFYKEAIAPAKLFHPNIVNIYDLDEEDGTPFIVMEFLDGLDLKYFRTAGVRFSVPQVLNILIQVSEGLHFAHRNGIIHRDVKPANIILLKNGTAKILDFGIARVAESTQQTRSGVALGTPAYMSPEQAKGQRVDPRTDQYAVGVIAYEMISGENPFQAENYTGVLYKIISYNPPPLINQSKECPPALSEAVMRSLAKESGERFPDLKVFSKVCQEVLKSYKIDESRLDSTLGSLESMRSTALEEPYKARLVRKYIKEFQFEAASRLLEKLKEESVDGTLVQSLQTELAGQSLRKRCADLLKIGQDMVEGGDFDLALVNLNEILELDPDNVEAITLSQKIRRLKKERVFKEQLEPLLKKASAKSSEGLYLEAIDLYRQVQALDPEYVEVKALVEENERLMARSARLRQLAADVQRAVKGADLPTAFARLADLEGVAPDQELPQEYRAIVWKALQGELASVLGECGSRDGLTRLRDWFATMFSSRAVVAYFSSQIHRDEKGAFLDEIRRTVREQMEQQNFDAPLAILEILQPVFPGLAVVQELAAEVSARKRSREEAQRRQLAIAQQLEDGIRTVHDLLDAGQVAPAEEKVRTLAAQFPKEKALEAVRQDVAEARRRSEADKLYQSQLDQVRLRLEANDLEGARGLLHQLESAFPRQAETRSLRSVLEDRERAVAYQEEIRRAREEITARLKAGEFDSALAGARQAAQRFPAELIFLELMGSIQEHKADFEKQEEIRQKAGEVNEFISKNQFLKAGKLAFDLRDRFTDSPAVVDLLKGFHEKRTAYIHGAVESARSFAANRAFDDARRILERAAAECPDALDLKNAIQETVNAEEVQKVMIEAKGYQTEKKYDLALATLEGLLARYPEETNIVQLYTEIRKQRGTYIQDSLQHAGAFVQENDFERAITLLRSALEIVPNATEIKDKIDEIARLQETFLRQRKEAAEEARLIGSEIENALSTARKFQAGGNLFDALRTLEETRRRFPKQAHRLESAIAEAQNLIDLQMQLPEIQRPEERRRRRRLTIGVAAACLVVAVGVAALLFLKPSSRTYPPPVEPAVLAIDIRPWGKVVEIVRKDTGEKVLLPADATPLQVTLAPGTYRVVYRWAGANAPEQSEELELKEREYRLLKKASPGFETGLDTKVEEILK